MSERPRPDSETAKLHAYLRPGSTPVTCLERDGTVLRINDAGLKNLARPRVDVVGRSIFELLPDMASTIRDRIERTFETGEPVEAEEDVLLPAGVRRFRSIMNPIPDSAGQVVAVQISSWDVTGEHETTSALRRANQTLSLIFEHSPYLILLLGRAGHIEYINRVGPGFRMEDVLGGDSHAFVHAEFHARYDATLAAAFGGAPASKIEFRDVHGSWWAATIVPVTDGDRVEQVISFSVDISEKRRSEEEQLRLQAQMQHAQKLESLGVLAGGIAHDFNNLLMVISVNADLARSRLSAESPANDFLDNLTEASQRAAELCRQMLAYAGLGRFSVERVDLSRVAADMTNLIEVSVSKGVRLERSFAPDLPAIEADPTQLRQVLLNLITNASDAIGDGQGVISLATRTERLAEASATISPSESLPAGEYVVLQVRDTGSGIDDATRARMFDPFFSTKASGRGLGLSATLGIIRHHRGAIDVDSKPGAGTTIRVFFPVVGGEVSAPAPRSPSRARGHGVILVVDDEPGVRRAVKAALTEAGYEVLSACDGQEALTLFDESLAAGAQRIRLVLLDLTMPKLSGEETWRALRARAPELPVVVMSGYSTSTLGDGSVRFLAKPFRNQDLTDAVAAELGSGDSGDLARPPGESGAGDRRGEAS